jgi:glycine oxidase
VNNQRLITALVAACHRQGVAFRPRNAVTKLNVRNGRIESAEGGPDSSGLRSTFFAGHFVLAAGCWSPDLMAPLEIELPMKPCRGQIIEFASTVELPLVVRAGHHYLVPRPPGRVLAGTTVEYAGFEKPVTGEGLRSILEGSVRFAPFISSLRFRRAWAGLRPDTADHLPILGYGEVENLIFATGHFRNGILLAPVTAQLISEILLTGSTSRAIDAYSPRRFKRPELAC